jgi:nucleotide-binding universal stress UspA family protein
MLTLKHILVAVDFTETSDKAFDFALELAAKFDTTVTAVHAFEIPVIGFPDGALVATADIASRIQEAARQGLDAAVSARQGRNGVKIQAILREGAAQEEIRAVADEIHADLIVIGTHGRKGIARALLGSVAENVIRTVKIPVLTIHGPRE